MKPARSAAPGIVTGPAGDRLTAAINYPLLVGAGWDRGTQVLAPDRDHRLLGYPLCLSPVARWRRGIQVVCAPAAGTASRPAGSATSTPSAQGAGLWTWSHNSCVMAGF
jgi:hypothetical protein